MADTKACVRETIPEEVMLGRLAQSEQMRDFFIQMWKQNPLLAKQGGQKVQNLLTPLEGGIMNEDVLESSGTGMAKQRGISLIELIMFIVIISVALVGILLVMNQVTRSSSDPLIRKQALAIAESMLEEIQLQDLSGVACAGTLGNNSARSGVSSVWDYCNYTTTGGILEFSDNTPVLGLAGYNITGVTVRQIDALGPTAITAGSGVRITVTVADPTGATAATATGYRAGR
jgi:MSHA pilin protein MshD